MTTSPPWQEIPADLPDDGETYWVVQYRWATTPQQAVWDLATATWTPRILTVAVPWYVFPWFREV